MVYATSSGSWKKTEDFLRFMQQERMYNVLDHYGRVGVDLLAAATPIDTGETAQSWGYQIGNNGRGRHSISWYNTHREGRVNIAIILQYGHGTGTGGWVEGRDYINPAIRPLFDKIVEDIWKQVRNG
jgi:hypothetical protein